MNGFYQLFIANSKIFFRNKNGFFWTIAMPAFIYIALSILPIGKSLDVGGSYSNFLLPGILAMAIMQTGIYSLAYWMVDLKTRGVLKRFLVTPVKPQAMVAGVLLSRIPVILLEVVVLSAIGILFFGASFVGNFFSILVLSILGGCIFLLIGLLISNYADSYESAAPFTSAIGLPFIFLGNIFYPASALPIALQRLSKILPITYLADGLRKAYTAEFSFSLLSFNFFMLVVWLVVLLVITIKVFKLREE